MPQLNITYIARGFVNLNGNNNNDEMGEEMIERSRIPFNNRNELQQLLLDDYERKIVPLYRPILTPDWPEDLADFNFVFYNGDDDAYADIFIENWRLLHQIDFRPQEIWNINNFPINNNNNNTIVSTNSPISVRSRSPSTFSVMSNNNLKGGKRRRHTNKRSTRRRRHTRRLHT
jgi:hypothetical protein